MTRPRRGDGERGATAVEFVIVAPLVFAFLMFLAYGGCYMIYGALVQDAANNAAKSATLVAETSRDYPALNTVVSAATGAISLVPGSSTVTVSAGASAVACGSVTDSGTTTQGDIVTVQVTQTMPVASAFSTVLSFLGSIPDTVTRCASERAE
jgi:Flp pilus assembly protein TadG